MPTETLTREERSARTAVPPGPPAVEEEDVAAARVHARRLRRARRAAAGWLVGSILVTALWMLVEWHANGAFERFAHEGGPGDWNPTLWAVVVGLWGLAAGILALRAVLRRPATSAEIDREAERLGRDPADVESRRVARTRLERVRQLRFHVAAWALGLVVLTPLSALIEWQDNGGFERWSDNSGPGDWDPWIFMVGGIWAFVVALLALRLVLDRPSSRTAAAGWARRLGLHA